MPGAAALPPSALAVAETTEGFLRGRARIARAGVLEYGDGTRTWGEYRSLDELRAAAPTFALILCTDDHPEEFVNAENARDLFRGFSASDVDVERGDDGVDYLVATITVADAEAIAKVRAGKRELSIGFSALVVEESGDFGGSAFEYKQTALEGNHFAIVDEGRAGPEVKIPIGDSVARSTTRIAQRKDDTPMEPVTIEINGTQYTVDPAVAAYIQALEQQVAAMQASEVEAAAKAPAPPTVPAAAAPVAPATPPAAVPQRAGDAVTAELVGRLHAERDAAVARAERAEAAAAQLDTRVDERTDLVLLARVLATDFDPKGKTDHAVRAAIAKAGFPSLATGIDEQLKIANDAKAGATMRAGAIAYLRAMSDAVTADDAGETEEPLGRRVADARAGVAGKVKADSIDAALATIDAAEDDYQRRRDGIPKQPNKTAAAGK